MEASSKQNHFDVITSMGPQLLCGPSFLIGSLTIVNELFMSPFDLAGLWSIQKFEFYKDMKRKKCRCCGGTQRGMAVCNETQQHRIYCT